MKEFRDFLFVDVPEDAQNFKLELHPEDDFYQIECDSQNNDEESGFYGDPVCFCIDIPSGSWEIVGRASELKEEDWQGIVEFRGYRENEEEMYLKYDEDTQTIIHTATASGLSLLKSLNLSPSCLVLKKVK